jgi:hypothetical protein
MRPTTIIAAALLAALAGCETPKKKPAEPPLLSEIPYGSTQNVRSGEIVKAYPIARYVDPSNKRVMHEKHTVYRLERATSWRLNPPEGKYDAVLLGPVAGVRKPYYKPSPTSAELDRALQKQQAATAASEQGAIAYANSAAMSLRDSRAALADAQNAYRSAQESRKLSDDRVATMEAELKTLRSSVAAAEKAAAEAKAQPQPTPQEERPQVQASPTPGPVEDPSPISTPVQTAPTKPTSD